METINEIDNIWDTSFRDILQNSPECMIPIINAIFDEDYSMETHIHKNNGKYILMNAANVEADTVFEIENKTYHFECQIANDKEMVIRMFEYDWYVAKDNREKGQYEINFPRSAVLYVDDIGSIPDELTLKVNFPEERDVNGNKIPKSVIYKIPTVKLSSLKTVQEIADREYYIFYIYYIRRIMRLASNKVKTITKEEVDKIYEEIMSQLNYAVENGKLTISAYNDIRRNIKVLINQVSEENEKMHDLLEGVENMLKYDIPSSTELKVKATIDAALAMGQDKNGIIKLLLNLFSNSYKNQSDANKEAERWYTMYKDGELNKIE